MLRRPKPDGSGLGNAGDDAAARVGAPDCPTCTEAAPCPPLAYPPLALDVVVLMGSNKVE